jgi:hypothetical protein
MTGPASSPPVPWACSSPGVAACVGVPQALPIHPSTPVDDLVHHLPRCRYDFLSVLDCMRERCYPARLRFMETIYQLFTERRQGVALGLSYGILGPDLEDAAMSAFQNVVRKATQAPSWAAEEQDAGWPRDDDRGAGIAPLLHTVITRELIRELGKIKRLRDRTHDVDPLGDESHLLDGEKPHGGPSTILDPDLTYARPLEPYVVDTLQNDVVSPTHADAMKQLLAALAEHIRDRSEDEQRMVWTFLRDWGSGGSNRSAMTAVFGTTPAGNPIRHNANNDILNDVRAIVREAVEDVARRPETRSVALNLIHAIQATAAVHLEPTQQRRGRSTPSRSSSGEGHPQ